MYEQIETTVLGGLPVTIEFEIDPSDRSVGYAGGADWWVSHVKGRRINNCDWIIKRMSEKEQEIIAEQCMESLDW